MQNNQLGPVLTPQQQAWIGLAASKNNLMASLQNKELQASGLLNSLNDPEIKDYRVIEEGLGSYRKIHSDMVKERLIFTKIIDEKIVQAVMIPEKNVDPTKNIAYANLNTKAFNMKKAEAAKVDEANAKNREKDLFANHVTNEYIRTVGQYRLFLQEEISKIYESNLKAKIQDPKPALDQFKAWIATTRPPELTGFMPTYLTEEEMTQIWKGIKPPDWSMYLNEAFANMDALFLNYDSALANAPAAIEANQQVVAVARMDMQEKDSKEIALNTLVSSSETVQIQGPVIKKTLVVRKSEGWDWEWTKNILTAFYLNIQHLEKHVRVKDSGNLKLSQMAIALGKLATETGVMEKGIIYDEVEK